MQKIIHPKWGEVAILTRFSSHYNVQTKQGVRQCHPNELKYLDVDAPVSTTNGEPNPPVPIPPEIDPLDVPPPPPLFPVNTATGMQIYKQFRPAIVKLVATRISERVPYADLDEFVEKTRDLFTHEDLARTFGAQLDFKLPETNAS